MALTSVTSEAIGGHSTLGPQKSCPPWLPRPFEAVMCGSDSELTEQSEEPPEGLAVVTEGARLQVTSYSGTCCVSKFIPFSPYSAELLCLG